jgi:sulfoxide reductase heme-binding subunit YedZ
MPWKPLLTRWLKAPIFLLCLAPVLLLARNAYLQILGANPIETITHETGNWTLNFLAITLAISPLRRWLGVPELIRYRRMLGLFAFFYGCFITAGFLGFICMAPLALTSTAGWIRRLGGRRWQMIHRLIYVSACAGVVHYYWLVKSDVRKPLLYGAIVAVLLGARLVGRAPSLRRPPRPPVLAQ